MFSEADAKLIIAAPDLLALLLEAKEKLRDEHESREMALGGHKFRDRCQTCELLSRIDAKLKEIEG